MLHDFLKEVLSMSKAKEAAVILIDTQFAKKDWGPTGCHPKAESSDGREILTNIKQILISI